MSSFKIPKRFSFRTRLFLAMITMLFVAGLLILGTTSIQYERQRENYHLGRLERKESQIKRHLDYLVQKHDLVSANDSLWIKNENDFEKINAIHNIQYSLFKTDGSPLLIYHSPLQVIANDYVLDPLLLNKIYESKKFVGFRRQH